MRRLACLFIALLFIFGPNAIYAEEKSTFGLSAAQKGAVRKILQDEAVANAKVSIDALYHVCSLRILRIPSREDARDEVEHVGCALIVVSKIANQALFNDVDLRLCFLVHNV